jgi:hypothetical protein
MFVSYGTSVTVIRRGERSTARYPASCDRHAPDAPPRRA